MAICLQIYCNFNQRYHSNAVLWWEKWGCPIYTKGFFSSRIFVDNEIGRLEILKEIVSVISSDHQCKDDNVHLKIVSSETQIYI